MFPIRGCCQFLPLRYPCFHKYQRVILTSWLPRQSRAYWKVDQFWGRKKHQGLFLYQNASPVHCSSQWPIHLFCQIGWLLKDVPINRSYGSQQKRNHQCIRIFIGRVRIIIMICITLRNGKMVLSCLKSQV